MCILFWTLDNHPKYKFIFAANRDEYLNRPTAYASWWHPNVLSGIDKLGLGTWLGINRHGNFAALTNYLEEYHPPPDLLSRGIPVKSILECSELKIPLYNQFEEISNNSNKYGGFNLIASDLSLSNPKFYYQNNRRNDGIKELKSAEIYGLSNSVLEDPWPKVHIGIEDMKSILKESTNESDIVDRLFNLLSKTETPEKLNKETDLWKHSIRIPKYDRGDGSYATRTSTVILVDRDNNVLFIEKNFFDENEEIKEKEKGTWYRFTFNK
ncbi:unnamed protein product [Rhizophagus irregularis]|uniref:DUF833-domain-containing protein n=1 Tax=Rhizophagus irregularis TaxID=588596 RepID=A0A916EBX1_9GLOM|nr:unnamed protein product [Rhizophagus irregularis]CAB5183839.1 unnamed protein product [Rhizophagus irregularis]CAB5375911.1 unnamed protein product [Rhizophagus irregularis]